MDAAERKTGRDTETRRTNMGRKRIRVELIPDERNRQVTFMKRKNGLLKKAMELSILCDCEIALVVLNNGTKKLVEYSSSEIDTVLSRFQRHRNLPHETHGNEDLYRQYFTDDTSYRPEGKGDSSEKNLVEDAQRSTPPPSWCASHETDGDATTWLASPKRETAHAHIGVAFDVLLHKIVAKQEAKGTASPTDVGSQAVRGMPSNDSRDKRQRITDFRVNASDNGSATQSVGNVPLDPRKFLDDLKKEASAQVPAVTHPNLPTSATFSQSQVHQSQRPYRVSLPSGPPTREDPSVNGAVCAPRVTRHSDTGQAFQVTGIPPHPDTRDTKQEIKREDPHGGEVEEYVLVNTYDGIMAVPVVKPELLPLSGVDLQRMEAVQTPSHLLEPGAFHMDGSGGGVQDLHRMMAERGCGQNSFSKHLPRDNGNHEAPCKTANLQASYPQGKSSTSMLLPFPANEVAKKSPDGERMDPNELANIRSMLIQRALLATREDEKAKDQVLSLDEGCTLAQEIPISGDQIAREVWDAAKDGLNHMGQDGNDGVVDGQVNVSGCQMMPLERALQLQKALLEKQ